MISSPQSSCARSAMEPRIQATTPAMTFSKAGWQILSKKKFFLFHTKWTNLATSWHQVDKMCPGEPEKVFHIDAEFFLNLLLQFPLRLQVIIFVGPINQTSTTYTWFQSLWFLPSFFLSGDPTGSNILQPVGSEAPRTRSSWPPPICSRPSQPLSGDHLTRLLPACDSNRKEKEGPTNTTLFLGFWDPFHILDMEVLSQGPMDRLRNGKTAKIISQARCALGNVLVTKIWFQVFYDQFDTLVLEEMADAWS